MSSVLSEAKAEVGPLPIWAWGGLATAALFGYQWWKNRQAAPPTTTPPVTTAPPARGSGKSQHTSGHGTRPVPPTAPPVVPPPVGGGAAQGLDYGGGLPSHVDAPQGVIANDYVNDPTVGNTLSKTSPIRGEYDVQMGGNRSMLSNPMTAGEND